ncbi:MAG TPA: cytochrome c-type biogenesis protein [Longimicrobiales bacterium]|nr:cytochrome c-type biogenesis protein [Longimicrobiales bacterium]
MIDRTGRIPLGALLLLAFLAVAATGQTAGLPERAVPAQDELELEARARAISSQLRCVVCQGLSVEDSPSELAQEMKNVVRDQLRQGKSEEEIKAYFVGRYGEFVLLEPEPRGFNLVVYLFPVLALLGGGLILFRAVRGWTRADADEATTDDASPPAETTPERV